MLQETAQADQQQRLERPIRQVPLKSVAQGNLDHQLLKPSFEIGQTNYSISKLLQINHPFSNVTHATRLCSFKRGVNNGETLSSSPRIVFVTHLSLTHKVKKRFSSHQSMTGSYRLPGTFDFQQHY
jgi:hypothetical protein